jgi:hypothetical protein
VLVLDVSQSADANRYSRFPPERPPECPLEYPLGHPIDEDSGTVVGGLNAADINYGRLGAGSPGAKTTLGAPVRAGADESASLRLIKTARLAICKRRHADHRVTGDSSA